MNTSLGNMLHSGQHLGQYTDVRPMSRVKSPESLNMSLSSRAEFHKGCR